MNRDSINIIKLGGSVITDKTSYKEIRKDNLSKICKQLLNSTKPYIIIHGAGSFGHIIAEKHSINDGFKNENQLDGLTRIRQDMTSLTQEVVSCLIEKNIKAISFQTSAFAFMKNTESSYFLDPIERSLSLGMCPVLSGDVLFTEEGGFTIHSGDSLISHLVKHFNVDQVIFLTDVDGLFEKSDDEEMGKLVRKLDFEEFKGFKADELRSEVIDVTGSMKGKVDEISTLLSDVEKVVILNGLHPERLGSVLKNEEVISTVIFGENST
jgi:isopentenyl phosphate kinase